MDKREDILNSEYNKWIDEKGFRTVYPNNFPSAYKVPVINSMDENGKRLCLELLEYMAKNEVLCVNTVGGKRFYYKGVFISSEELFENFL